MGLWVRLGDISTYGHSTQKVNAKKVSDEHWILDLEDIEKGGKILRYKTAKEVKAVGDKTIFHKGEILYSKLRPYLLKTLIAPSNGICTPELIAFNCYGTINHKYIVYFLKSPYVNYNVNKATYGIKMPRIGTDTMINLLLPLPPLAEQQRIVKSIEILMSKLDELEKIENELDEIKNKFPENLRDSLLQAAIQGKLTEQLESDGTAEELLKKIYSEKKRLIAEGKIKKEKPLPPISEEEKPFDIPENWTWVRFADIFYKITDGTHSTPKYTKAGIPFLSVKDISSGKIDLTNTKFISQEEHSELYKRCNPEKGDLLITKVGTTGVPAIVDTDIEFSLFVSVALLKFFHAYANINYLYYTLKSPLIQEQAKENTRGVGNKNWVLDAVKNTIFPLPPLAEQERIVERLNELLPLCEKYI